ncbi:Zinc finger protein 182, partial [Frankliniella fusca]
DSIAYSDMQSGYRGGLHSTGEPAFKSGRKKKFKCPQCPRWYRWKSTMVRHVRTECGFSPQFQCPHCPLRTVRKDNLAKHINTKHGRGMVNYMTNVPCSEPYKLVLISLCNLPDVFNFIGDGSAQRSDLGTSCPVCGKKLSSKQAVVGHLRTHTGERPYQCDVCSATFVYPGDLIRHKRSHTKDRPYQCPYCPQRAFRKDNLVMHISLRLTGVLCCACAVLLVPPTLFQCPVCAKYLSSKHSLKEHARTHTGEKPYQCGTCGAAFAYAGHLLRHRRSHTNERPYKCNVCPAAFNQSTHLHVHTRIHTGDKPFACAFCGMSFTESSKRRRHVLIRHGVDVRPSPSR